jgi:predicted PurR-regulated permease PerM
VIDAPVSVRHLGFTLLSIGIVILLLQFMQPVLIPLVLGALLFYALDPAVDWMERIHVPRAIGAALMLLVVLSACGALAYSLQGQALTVIDELPAGAR